jgi:hypothetical protein
MFSQSELKEIYERLTYLKPVVTFSTGIINYEDDLRKIIQGTNLSKTAKL